MSKSFPTPSATVGPFFPPHYFGNGDNDLGFIEDRNKYAQGQRIYISGRVNEADRVPRWNTIIELWQADASGCFAHPNDPRAEMADPNFMGWGRRWTENDGFFDFLTVKPGSYLDPLTGKMRAPHINVSLMSSGLMRRLVTTVFFPAETGNAGDPVFAAVGNPEAQERLILKPARSERAPAGALAYELDIVLQGEGETPFFVD